MKFINKSDARPDKDYMIVFIRECWPPTYVTQEMALDAGDLSLEGSLYSNGHWEPDTALLSGSAIIAMTDEEFEQTFPLATIEEQ